MINDMDTVVHMGFAAQIPLMKDLLLVVVYQWPVAFCPFRDGPQLQRPASKSHFFPGVARMQ